MPAAVESGSGPADASRIRARVLRISAETLSSGSNPCGRGSISQRSHVQHNDARLSIEPHTSITLGHWARPRTAPPIALQNPICVGGAYLILAAMNACEVAPGGSGPAATLLPGLRRLKALL